VRPLALDTRRWGVNTTATMARTLVRIPVAVSMEVIKELGLDKMFVLLPFRPGSDLYFLVFSNAIPML
jgi:hypothetical protein